jgi:hypothetical protein
MTRRKGEVTPRMNEREAPYLVELRAPPRGFGATFPAIYSFHRNRGIEIRSGRRQRRDDQEFVRWCFADAETAADFQDQFGGELLPIAAKLR